MVAHEIYETLTDLSDIFTEGFTVTRKQGKFNQYNNPKKPFIVSHTPIITLDKNTFPPKIKYHKLKALKLENCIIGGWIDTDTQLYYIEINKTFKSMVDALVFAYKHKQLYIYNMGTQKAIEVKPWERKIRKWLNE